MAYPPPHPDNTLPGDLPNIDIRPTIDQVASYIRARTKDNDGHEVGTFTDATRPTDVQADEAIDEAMAFVEGAVASIGMPCAPLASAVVAIGAAAWIELSYFPEQARSDRSAYQFLVQRYNEYVTGLQNCVANNLPGGGASSLRFFSVPLTSSTVVFAREHWFPDWIANLNNPYDPKYDEGPK